MEHNTSICSHLNPRRFQRSNSRSYSQARMVSPHSRAFTQQQSHINVPPIESQPQSKLQSQKQNNISSQNAKKGDQDNLVKIAASQKIIKLQYEQLKPKKIGREENEDLNKAQNHRRNTQHFEASQMLPTFINKRREEQKLNQEEQNKNLCQNKLNKKQLNGHKRDRLLYNWPQTTKNQKKDLKIVQSNKENGKQNQENKGFKKMLDLFGKTSHQQPGKTITKIPLQAQYGTCSSQNMYKAKLNHNRTIKLIPSAKDSIIEQEEATSMISCLLEKNRVLEQQLEASINKNNQYQQKINQLNKQLELLSQQNQPKYHQFQPISGPIITNNNEIDSIIQCLTQQNLNLKQSLQSLNIRLWALDKQNNEIHIDDRKIRKLQLQNRYNRISLKQSSSIIQKLKQENQRLKRKEQSRAYQKQQYDLQIRNSRLLDSSSLSLSFSLC